MSHRFICCIFLALMLTFWIRPASGQFAPLADCPDTQPFITGPDVICDQNSTLTYTYGTPPTLGTPTHSYQWSITPATGRTIVGSTTQNQLQVKWLNPGTYTIQITEWNNDPTFTGCTGIVATKTINVLPLLHAYFYYEFDPAGGCFYNVVNFKGDVSVHADPNITYTWDFGDGTPVTPGPGVLTHTFPVASDVTYTVKLTVTNSAGFSDQIIDYVYVNPDQYKPVANFTHTATPVPNNCLYNPMTFDASSSLPKPPTNPENISIIYYEWDFDDPGSGSQNIINSGTNPVVNHTFSTPGVHNIKLTVTNSKYCQHTITIPVTIENTIPTASFTNTLACLGESTTFTTTSVTPVGTLAELEWIFGDGSSYTSTNPAEPIVHTYGQLGTYTAKLRVKNSNNCYSEYFSKAVSVNPSPMASFLVGNACLGDAVQFTNTSTLNGGSQISGYLWNFDDPASGSNTSTDPNPTHLFSSVGNYNVSLQATNSDGCANTYILTPPLTVSPKPSVDFTYQNGTVNWEILFFNLTPPTVGNNLVWDFGDGTYGYGPNPSHIYQGPGNFLVTLTATDAINGCSNSIQQQITMTGNASAFFTTDSPKCIGDTMHFTPQIPGGNIVKEVWDFGDGNIVTFSPPAVFPIFATHIYTASGTFTVTRTVTYVTNFYESFSLQVTVYPRPTASFTYSNNPAFPNTYACAHQAVFFTDLSYSTTGNIIEWFWDFGDAASGVDNTSVLQNPQHVFTDAGKKYKVTLTVTDNVNNCRHTFWDSVYINPEVPVDFTFTNNTCLNQVVNFTQFQMYPDSIATWDWDFGDGSIHATTPGNASHLYISPGNYNAVLTVTDIHGCSNAMSKTVTVMPRPVSAFTFASPTCSSSPMQFTNQSYIPSGFPGFIDRWIWVWGDGTRDTIYHPNSANLAHLFPAGPTYSYNVTLVVRSSFGCLDSITHQINLIPAPSASFEVVPGTPTCATQVVQFNDLSQTNGGGSLVGWLWNFDDPTSGSNNSSTSPSPSHLFVSPRVYNVSLVVTNASGCSHTIILPITIDSLPVANFKADTACSGEITSFTNTTVTPVGTNITSYNWSFGDGNTSTLQSPQHTYATYGIYNVTLTVTNNKGCIHSVTKQVKVSPKPVPAFTFSPASCLGNPVSFTDLSFIPAGFTGYIYKWTWDFGDGSPTETFTHPQAPNTTHIYTGTATSYTVRLTVQTSDSCIAYLEKTVNHIPSPLANFTYSPTTCIGQTVNFSDLTQTNGGGSIQSWSWNFGDPLSGTNNISTLQNPIHAFTAAQKYYITLQVTSTNGCTHTKIDSVTINPLPVANFEYTSACEGSETSFNSSTTNPNSNQINSYSWNFGDGGTSTLANPVHIFSTFGTFQVSLTVVNSNGCIHTRTKPVVIKPKPIANFTFSAGACLGSVVSFTDQSFVPSGLSAQIKTWHWDFGDGTTQGPIVFPATPHTTHTYNGPGTSFVVRLTVMTFDSCYNSIEKTVNVVAKPAANFSFASNRCENQPVQFTDLSQTNGGGSIQTWAWNFGDPASGGNNNSTIQHPVHSFTSAAASPYTVRLIVTNGNGCKDTTEISVTVNAKPLADFEADTVCLGTVTTFNSLSGPTGTITSYLWDFGDGSTSSGATPSHLYATSGVFNVKLIVGNAGQCLKDTTKPVLVLGKPVASFTYASPNCAGDSVQFTDLSSTPHGTIQTWKWNFGDGTPEVIVDFPDNQNVKHFFTNGGNYPVQLTIITSDGCEISKTNTVQVGFRPQANFSFPANPCASTAVPFTDLSQTNGGSSITTWNWNFGDPASGTNNTSTTQNPSHIFSTGGTYTVRLEVTNANGCTDTVDIPKTITIKDAPVAIFSYDTACMNSPTSFTDESTTAAGSIITWSWNFGDPASGSNNTSTQQNPTHTYTMQGTFNVTLSVTNSDLCVKDTMMTITVSPKPTASFSYTPACVNSGTQFTDLSTAPGSSIQSRFWDFGDGGTSTDPDPVHIYTTPGTYQVKLKVKNLANCEDSVVVPVITRPQPTPDFTYSSVFCPSGQVTFQDISSATGATIAERTWIFPTMTIINNPSPTYVFANTNVWDTVTLIVKDSHGCSDTITDSVFIKPGFEFTFTNDTNICDGYAMRFYPQNNTPGDSLYSVSWNFGDPASGPANNSTLFKPTHVFSRTGIFVVKMKAYNSDNCVDSVFREIRVWAKPEPAFSHVNPACNDTVFFSDTTQYIGDGPITSWTWNFGDGNSTTINSPGPGHTSHYYANAGIYPVTLVMRTIHGCVDSITKNVQRFPCIKADFKTIDTLCARYQIAFSDSSLPVSRINQWTWNWGDGTPPEVYATFTPTVYHTYASAGTYNVSLEIQAQVSGTNITDVRSGQVVIRPTPEAFFANPSTCLEQLTLFHDTSLTYGENITKWQWNFSGSPTDTSSFKNPKHLYDTAGIYNVRLIVNNRFGCADTLEKATRVYGLPEAHFTNTAACIGDPTLFSDISLESDTILTSWSWYFNYPSLKDSSNLQDPSFKYKATGDFTVRMVVRDYFGCQHFVDSLIRVNVTPLSAFTLIDNYNGRQGQVKLTNLSTGADNYTWEFGNGKSSTDENPVATFTEDDTYSIKLISRNQFDCSDTTIYEYKLLFKGLYVPNAFAPTSTNLGVRLFQPAGSNLKYYHVRVFDTWGHLVWESTKLDDKGAPVEGWDGTYQGALMPQGNYMWKIDAMFVDDSPWNGSSVSSSASDKTMGTVTLIR